MSDQFKTFLAQHEAQKRAQSASQRWLIILAVLVVLIVLAVVIFRGDPSSRPLDPNTASAAELITLPEVGPEMAQLIIEKRADKPFTKADDLLDVKGIGPKTLAKIKPRLKFETK
jgi:competence protein ComEA